jgi:hypothetical protein
MGIVRSQVGYSFSLHHAWGLWVGTILPHASKEECRTFLSQGFRCVEERWDVLSVDSV